MSEHESLDDEQLVDRFVEGDSAAFEEIVRRYESRVRKLVFGFVRSPELAEDIAQDTFLRAHQKLAGLSRRGSLRSWLFQVAINRARDELRRAKRWDWTSELPEEMPAGPDASALRGAEQRELGRWLAALISELPEKSRIPLILKEVEGMTYAEIAAMLEVPMGTVQIRIHRARHRLRARLAELGFDLSSGATGLVERRGRLRGADEREGLMSPRTCQEIRPLLSAWHDGEVVAGEPGADLDRVAIDRHLESCARCRAELAQIGQISNLLRVPPEDFASDPGFLVRFRQRLADGAAPSLDWLGKWPSGGVGACVCCRSASPRQRWRSPCRSARVARVTRR